MEKHHWIPQFYLKYWRDPQAPVGQRGRIWIFEKDAQNWRTDFPKNLAFIPEFYSLEKKDGKLTNVLEKEYLQKIENNVAKIINNKLLKNKILSDKEKSEIALFISLFIFRSPNFINKIKGFVDGILNDWVGPEIIKRIQKRSYSDKELADLKKEYKKDTGREINIEEMKKQIKNIDREDFQLKLSKNRLLFSVFSENIANFARFFHSFNWQFMKGRGFISGDMIFSSPFPLTPEICIAMNNFMDDNIFINLDSWQIEQINKKIFENAEHFIISTSKINYDRETKRTIRKV